MQKHLGLPPAGEERQKYFVSNAFDHDVVPERVNSWLMRAWSGYVMSVDSLVALIGALGVGKLILHINPMGWWGIMTVLAVFVLLWNAALSWRRYIGMLELQAQRPIGSFDKPKQDRRQ
jgi:hypothetical protein